MNPTNKVASPKLDVLTDIEFTAVHVSRAKLPDEPIDNGSPELAIHRPCTDVDFGVFARSGQWSRWTLTSMVIGVKVENDDATVELHQNFQHLSDMCVERVVGC